VTELRGRVHDQEQALDRQAGITRTLESEVDTVKRELQAVQARLKESADVIKNNQSVIVYLNQLVNSESLGGYISAPADSVKTEYRATRQPIGLQSLGDTMTAVKSQRPSAQRESPNTVTRAIESPLGDNNKSSNYEEDVYLQGLRNLGLGDSPGKLKVEATYLHTSI
jgi:hypothetical protein